ncbi:MAG: Ig-like domain-containing protein, partial [Bacillota bacterium]|nr:Ig-like domain-containing protein [Bacillota bacterium]
MKKGKKRFLKSLIVMLVASMVFTSFLTLPSHTSTAGDSTKAAVKQVAPKVLSVGESYTVELPNNQAGASYQWRSSDNAVASANGTGLVKAIGPGAATITCIITKNKKVSTCTA